MPEKPIEEIQVALAKTGRVQLGAKEFPSLEKLEKNIRYVYNPNPWVVRITGLNVRLAPGELVDLVQVVGNPEKVFSSTEVINAVENNLLIGFSSFEELQKAYTGLPKPKTSPIEEVKATAVVVGPEGKTMHIEEVVKEGENPYTEALIEDYKREEEEVKRLEEQTVKKTSRKGKRTE
jgi:hypothetical protein